MRSLEWKRLLFWPGKHRSYQMPCLWKLSYERTAEVAGDTVQGQVSRQYEELAKARALSASLSLPVIVGEVTSQSLSEGDSLIRGRELEWRMSVLWPRGTGH